MNPIFSHFFFPSPGSLVQAALTQQDSVSANLGETIKITCSGSSNNYGWFQQKSPGSAPVTVIYQNTNRPSGISLYFSGSTTGFVNITLTMMGIQAEDVAVCYCGSRDTSSLAGTPVMVNVFVEPDREPENREGMFEGLLVLS
uniref:Immunoglobulin V-set domain-containing protein n=1 Tax=Meleagris gallopavo TaxID=9103 RepID=G1N5T4_MELGA